MSMTPADPVMGAPAGDAVSGAVRLALHLADGAWHSESAVAAGLGVSVGEVDGLVARLAALDTPVAQAAGKLALAAPLDVVDGQALSVRTGATVLWHPSVPSTQGALKALSADDDGVVVVGAEHQSAGIGRQGRAWSSPLCAGVWLSCRHRVGADAGPLQLLGLAVAMELAETFRARGALVSVKWPNDLMLFGRKLGGLLVDAVRGADGCHLLVVGVGINVHSAPVARDATGSGFAWLDAASAAALPAQERWWHGGWSRQHVATHVIEAIQAATTTVACGTLESLVDRFAAVDAYHGQCVHVVDPNEQCLTGRSLGIDTTGAIRLWGEGGLVTVASGRLRPCLGGA